MTKEVPLFRDIKTWLDTMCRTYTLQEVQMFGVLGFDLKHSDNFAQSYMHYLMKERDKMAHQKIAKPDWQKPRFAELNERIYSHVMSDIRNSPDWIRNAADAENAAQIVKMSPLKQRLVKIYQKSLQNQALIISLNNSEKTKK